MLFCKRVVILLEFVQQWINLSDRGLLITRRKFCTDQAQEFNRREKGILELAPAWKWTSDSSVR